MKYLLVREDEAGVEQLWGRCAGVEGLFVDPLPPPREVLTLRGYSPDGPLGDALAEPNRYHPVIPADPHATWDDLFRSRG